MVQRVQVQVDGSQAAVVVTVVRAAQVVVVDLVKPEQQTLAVVQAVVPQVPVARALLLYVTQDKQ
jgi:hypothetical protein